MNASEQIAGAEATRAATSATRAVADADLAAAAATRKLAAAIEALVPSRRGEVATGRGWSITKTDSPAGLTSELTLTIQRPIARPSDIACAIAVFKALGEAE